jgi:hypothetical protein
MHARSAFKHTRAVLTCYGISLLTHRNAARSCAACEHRATYEQASSASPVPFCRYSSRHIQNGNPQEWVKKGACARAPAHGARQPVHERHGEGLEELPRDRLRPGRQAQCHRQQPHLRAWQAVGERDATSCSHPGLIVWPKAKKAAKSQDCIQVTCHQRAADLPQEWSAARRASSLIIHSRCPNVHAHSADKCISTLVQGKLVVMPCYN